MGSGSTRLSLVFKVDEDEFKELSRSVKLRSLEHAFYYKVFLEVHGEPPRPKGDEKSCPCCGAGIPRGQNYCRYCGWYSGG